MKKILLISIFLITVVTYNYAQTYYYKCVASIDKNGERTKGAGGMYITFVNDKSVCYQSDSEGYKYKFESSFLPSTQMNTASSYQYRKQQKGTLVYQAFFQYGNQISYHPFYYYFSSDLSKMHSYSEYGSSSTTREYIRTNGPEDIYDDKIPVF